jgi:hypothetical protein
LFASRGEQPVGHPACAARGRWCCALRMGAGWWVARGARRVLWLGRWAGPGPARRRPGRRGRWCCAVRWRLVCCPGFAVAGAGGPSLGMRGRSAWRGRWCCVLWMAVSWRAARARCGWGRWCGQAWACALSVWLAWSVVAPCGWAVGCCPWRGECCGWDRWARALGSALLVWLAWLVLLRRARAVEVLLGVARRVQWLDRWARPSLRAAGPLAWPVVVRCADGRLVCCPECAVTGVGGGTRTWGVRAVGLAGVVSGSAVRLGVARGARRVRWLGLVGCGGGGARGRGARGPGPVGRWALTGPGPAPFVAGKRKALGGRAVVAVVLSNGGRAGARAGPAGTVSGWCRPEPWVSRCRTGPSGPRRPGPCRCGTGSPRPG